MSGLECGAAKVGQGLLSAFYDKIKTYVNLIKNCEANLVLLVDNLETLRGDKDTIDIKVLEGKENLKKLTPKAELWFERLRKLVIDESMKMLMHKDMRVAKVMLRLMKNDLKKLIEDDADMRDLVVKVMKDIAKRKRKAGNREGSDVDEKEKQVGQVLEKLIEETIMGEFKKLMQNDEKMAIAAMHLLENDKKKLEELMEKDEEMADIIAKARKMSEDAELLSDNNNNHDDENVVENVNTLTEKVKKLLKPVWNLTMHEEFLKTLPENVSLGIQAIDAVIGNRKGLKAELMDSDNAASHRNSCCCVISYNYFSDRYHMSVAAEAMLLRVEGIKGTKPGSEDVTRPIRRGEMERIPTNCVGLESRDELLQKIMKALESSDVHAVGVYGMGGSAATLLLEHFF